MRKGRETPFLPFGSGTDRRTPEPGSDYVRGELLAYTETEEQARELATLYGIDLRSWGNGLALFTTLRDVKTVVREGKANGWPELSLNRISHLD